MPRPQHMFVLVGLLLLVFAHVMTGGYVGQIMQPGAFLVAVLLPAAAATLVHRGGLLRAIQEALGDGPLESTDALRWMGILRSTRALFVAGGGLAILLGLNSVLRNIADPSKVGAGIALAWVASLYMVVAAERCLAPRLRQLAVRGLLPQGGLPPSDSPPGAGTTGTLITALLLSFGLLEAAHIIEGGSFGQLIQPTAVLLICASGFFALGWHGPTTLKKATLCAPAEDSRREDLQVRIQVLLSLRTAIYAMAALGYLLGHIHVMAHLDDPKKLGAGFAVATVVWLVAVLLAEFVLGPPLLRLRTACSVRTDVEDPLERAGPSDWVPGILLVASVVVMTVLALYSVTTFG
jgi:flagellar motor component MotA